MNEIMLFKNEEFGSVRTVDVKGKVYFVASDVAKALGYEKERNAIKQHCPHALKQGIGVQTGTKRDGTPAMQTIKMSIIPENDVYRLIAHSKLPSAQKFESWIYDEVIPSVIHTGGYITGKQQDVIVQVTKSVVEQIIPIVVSETVKRTINTFSNNPDILKGAYQDSAFKTLSIKEPPAELSADVNCEEVDFWESLLREWRRFRMPKQSKAKADKAFIALCRDKYPEFKIGLRTLYRKWKADEKSGRQGLVDGRGKHGHHKRKLTEITVRIEEKK